MNKKIIITLTILLSCTHAVMASEETVQTLEEYFEFVEYGGATIWPEQIPKDDWTRFYVIDARDQTQFDKDHIPGAVNIEWRQVLARRADIPQDKPVLIYCNSGSLSAQAGLALRIVGYENVLILQGGFNEWRSKGGFGAYDKALQANKPEGAE